MRTSPGCFACKVRHKRCNLARPVCSGCLRNFLICSYPPSKDSPLPEEPPAPSSSSERRTPSPSQVARRPMPQVASNSRPALTIQPDAFPNLTLQRGESHYLFSYFVNHTARAICIRSSRENPFLHILIPLALQYDMVLQALLAFTGAHSLQFGLNYYRTTYEHYAQAIRALKFGLTELATSSEGSSASLPLSICALLFCFMEVSVCDSDFMIAAC